MMKRWTWAPTALLAFASVATAQEPATVAPPPSASRTAAPPESRDLPLGTTPLRVQIVFSKFQGEKKVASLPYALTCNTGERQAVVLRMGIEVPVPVPVTQGKEGGSVVSFQYKNVGTNIDCRAGMASPDGRFRLDLTVEQSSIYSVSEDKARRSAAADGEGKPAWGMPEAIGSVPMFRNFRSTFNPILRDGQTVQYTTATDPVSGEVVKIDVTVNVVK